MRLAIFMALAWLMLATAGPALADGPGKEPLFRIIYSANEFGEYRPCPT